MSGKEASSSKEVKKRPLKKQLFPRQVPMNLADSVLVDVYEKATSSQTITRKKTALIYPIDVLNHFCIWDVNHMERPERVEQIWSRFITMPIKSKVVFLSRNNLKEEEYFLKKHSLRMYKQLEQTQDQHPMKLKTLASFYDSVFFNEYTFNSAISAASSVNELVTSVLKGEYQNGFAVVRPPGHHAMENKYCGFCFFNNVALAAQDILDQKLAEKILIVDFDVHHGQGTQQMFYEDNRVLYFSIHRYEFGEFWPNLMHSNFNYIGENNGKGYNINFPLNETGLNDNDYLNIVFHILLPVAYEWQPDIIIFSAGYDASVGDFEGLMNVTPAFYQHLISLLSGLANGKLVVCLEGGYFLPSLVEGAARTLLGLIDYKPASLPVITKPRRSVENTIYNLKYFLRDVWKCFNYIDVTQVDDPEDPDIHKVTVEYKGTPDQIPFPIIYNQENLDEFDFKKQIDDFIMENPIKAKKPVAYAFNPVMLTHEVLNKTHPENPKRLKVLYDKFVEFTLNERCILVSPIEFNDDILKAVHSKSYICDLLAENYSKFQESKDIYTSDGTLSSIKAAVGSLLGVVESVMNDESSSGVALIRPPGHHANCDTPSGFCFINNIAVAAKYILNKFEGKRILILDWDVHHGNGTQSIFYNSNQVLFISIHRYDNGKFFPTGENGNFDKVGKGIGLGYNVNIPLNGKKLGDSDYLAVFFNLILPIAYSFNPDIVLISAGFDAGVNDTIGNYCVTPEAFGHFVQLLKGLADGKLVLSLEGGYNPTTVAYSMIMCTKTLLGDTLPKLENLSNPNPSTYETIKSVINAQKKYWPILETNKKIFDKVSYSPGLNEAESLNYLSYDFPTGYEPNL